MKNFFKLLGIIAFVAVFGFSMIACSGGGGNSGPGSDSDPISNPKDYDYIEENGTITIVGYTGPGGNIAIPEKINGKPVTTIGGTSGGDYIFWIAFSDCTSITKVTIPNSVTKIGEAAFQNCTSLTSVTIPNSVTKIGYWAFYGCTSLTGITIPNSVTSIENNTFMYCTSLTSITIPNSVTKIGQGAFSECTSLASVTIGNSVTKIGESAFNGCTSLTSITIPDSVTSIGYAAFQRCTSLTSITIGNGVTNFEWLADFFDYTSLTTINVDANNTEYSSTDGVLYDKNKTTLILCPRGKTGTYTIPDSVTSIERNAFESSIWWYEDGVMYHGYSSCTSLTAINVDAGNTTYSSQDGVLYTKDKTALIKYPAGKAGTSFTIPDSVTGMAENSFMYCTSLESVTLGNSVTGIGWDAFYGCANLTAINVDAGNTKYSSQNGILYNKEKTTLIKYPEGRAENYFTISGSITKIDYQAFHGCKKITSVTIGNSVTSIEGYAFIACTSLTSVTFQGTIPQSQFDNYSFDGDLRDKYLASGTGTYTRPNGNSEMWTKQ
jgi:hypothetical protein